MAHADYDCCMICDSNLEYVGFESSTKERLCTDCLERLWKLKVKLFTPNDLIKYIKPLKWTVALAFLHTIGYEPCYYDNRIDTFLAKRHLITTRATDGKWGKRLRKLPISTKDIEK